MSKDCFIGHPLQRDGTSQKQRLTKALDPKHVLVDERGLSDLLLYARKFSKLIRFYNRQNASEGNWVSFIESDISTLVSLIKVTDLDKQKKAIFAEIKKIDNAPVAAKSPLIELLFEKFSNLALMADDWYRKSIPGLLLNEELKIQIPSILNDAIRNAISYELSFADWNGSTAKIDATLLSPIWKLDNIHDDLTFFSNELDPSEVDFSEFTTRLRQLFQSMIDSLSAVVNKAPDFLDETINAYPSHQPYMAL
ncbi:MAG: hypothetical protein KAI29_30845, partial [Cyclobacteriaceae bacterium]|nr:hypothetical protein [Cyclobacteriaceae bacterium]